MSEQNSQRSSNTEYSGSSESAVRAGAAQLEAQSADSVERKLQLLGERPHFSEDQRDFLDIIGDTDNFTGAMSGEYPVLEDISKMLASGNTSITFDQHIVSKAIDEEWVSAIEDGLIYLDEAIRKPRVEIIEVEEVKPIELTKKVSERSIKFLSQHTDLINDYDPETDMVTPTKILNVFKEEDLLTYENKFVNTLIRTLYSFIDKRYRELRKQNILSGSSLNFVSEFQTPTADGKMTFSLELTEASSNTSSHSKTAFYDPLFKRVEKLHEVVSGYMTSDFAKKLGNNVVTLPIKLTNAISKNKNLRQCRVLLSYINSYRDIGFEIAKHELSETPDKAYLDKLYSMLSLQYVTYRNELERNLEPDEPSEDGAALPYTVSRDQLQPNDYNVYDNAHGCLVAASEFNKRPKVSSDERALNDELIVALNASYYFEIIAPVLGAERLKRYFKTGMSVENMVSFAENTRRRQKEEALKAVALRERLLKKESERNAEKEKLAVRKAAELELMETVDSIAKAEAVHAIGTYRRKEKLLRATVSKIEHNTLFRFAVPTVKAAIDSWNNEKERFQKYYDFAIELSEFEAKLVWDAFQKKKAEEKRKRDEALRLADAESYELIADVMFVYDYEQEQLNGAFVNAVKAATKEISERVRIEEERRAEEERQRRLEEERKRRLEEQKRIEEERRLKREEERKRSEEERRRRIEAQRKAEEERRLRLAEEKKRAEEERRRRIEAQRKAEEERRLRLQEQKKAEEERRRMLEEERRRKLEEERKAEEERLRRFEEERRAEEERQRKLEEERRAEEERLRKLEEERKAEEERQRRLEEERRAEEERQRKLEEERRAEEERQRKLEEDRRAEEERQRKLEEERKTEEERKRRIEQERRRRIEEERKRAEEERSKEAESGALGALKKGLRSLFRK